MKDYRIPLSVAVPSALGLIGLLWLLRRKSSSSSGAKRTSKPAAKEMKHVPEWDDKAQSEQRSQYIEKESTTISQRKIPESQARDRGSSDLTHEDLPGVMCADAGQVSKNSEMLTVDVCEKTSDVQVSKSLCGQGDGLTTSQRVHVEHLITTAMGDGLQEAHLKLSKPGSHSEFLNDLSLSSETSGHLTDAQLCLGPEVLDVSSQQQGANVSADDKQETSDIKVRPVTAESVFSREGNEQSHPQITVSAEGNEQSHPQTTVSAEGNEQSHPQITVSAEGNEQSHPQITVSAEGNEQSHPQITVSAEGNEQSHPQITVSAEGSEQSHPQITDVGSTSTETSSAIILPESCDNIIDYAGAESSSILDIDHTPLFVQQKITTSSQVSSGSSFLSFVQNFSHDETDDVTSQCADSQEDCHFNKNESESTVESIHQISADDSMKAVSTDESEKAVSAVESEKAASSDELEKAVSTDESDKAVSTDESEKAASSDELEKEVSTDESEKAVSAVESDKAVSTDESQKAVSTDESEKAVSTVESEKAVSTDESEKAVSTDESEKAVSTVESEKAVSTDESEKTVSTDESEKAVSIDEPEKAVSTVESEKAVSTVESEKTVSTDESDKAVSIDEPEKAVSTVESEKAVSTVESEKTVSTDESDKAVSTDESKKAVSTDESEKAKEDTVCSDSAELVTWAKSKPADGHEVESLETGWLPKASSSSIDSFGPEDIDSIWGIEQSLETNLDLAISFMKTDSLVLAVDDADISQNQATQVDNHDRKPDAHSVSSASESHMTDSAVIGDEQSSASAVVEFSDKDAKNDSPAKSNSPLCDNNSEGSNDSGRGGSEHDVACQGGEPLVHYDFNMPSELCGRFIGKQGKNINYLKSKTGAHLSLTNNPFTPDYQICQIVGTQTEVDDALSMIRRKFPDQDYPLLTLAQINMAPPVLHQPEHQLIIPDVMQLSLPEGVSVEVFVSAIVDAGHLFIQQPTHRSFMSLEKLNYYLGHVYGQEPNIPTVPTPVECGIICVCENDGFWYRTMIMSPEDDNGESQVKFVDYGGYAMMPVSALKQIRADFMSLPFQAVECFMANIMPNQNEEYFSNEATLALSEMTQGKLLQCQVVARVENSIPYIHLYQINTENSSAVMINRALVNNHLVRWIEIL